MSQRPEFVQIEAGEDVSSIKDRLSFLRGQRVLLIWPEEGTALTRKLDLVLIQREAMRRAIRLALVTHDPEVIKNATELNISTFETIGASERGRWRRGRSKVFTNRQQRPKDEPEAESLMPVASRVRGDGDDISPLRRWGFRLAFIAAMLAVVGGVTYVVVPGATVDLTLAEQQVEASVDITADPSRLNDEVDVENAVIPTRIIRLDIEDSTSIPTTGQQTLESVQAIGSVTFINRTASTVSIPLGTIVSTGTGGTPVQFRTTQELSLPAGDGQEAEAAIEAMPNSAGDVGNVPANVINVVVGPLENSLSVINRAPTFGGQNRTVGVVTETDAELLLGALRQQLQSRAFADMQPLIGESQFIIDESIRIAEEREDARQFSAEVGDVADTLTLTMRVTVEAIAVDEQLGQQIVFARMADQIERGRVIRPESITYRRGAATVNADGTITFNMTGNALVAGQIDSAQLQQRLAGRPLDDVLTYLMREVDVAEGTSPSITLSPDWFSRMPLLPQRITIRAAQPS
ncbi:MAG: hypothetical protein SF029_04115 [bacterium]|nr:hypothetical protein [bacterium]